MKETTFEKIKRKSGRKSSDCKCKTCQHACKVTVGIATPEEILKLIKAGYADRLVLTTWSAGKELGLTTHSPEIIALHYDREKGACTFFKNGLCELHDTGLKPTECRLAHHSFLPDKFNPKKAVSWLIIKEWMNIKDEQIKILIDKIFKP